VDHKQKVCSLHMSQVPWSEGNHVCFRSVLLYVATFAVNAAVVESQW